MATDMNLTAQEIYEKEFHVDGSLTPLFTIDLKHSA